MMRKVLEALGAGWIVYVTMAACSSAGGSGGHHSSGGTAGGGGAVAEAGDAAGAAGGGGTQGVDGSTDASVIDAIADALTDPVPDATANESGTRLHARRWVADDGAKQFVGWRDTQRNEDCSFLSASDGVTRCLPTSTVVTISFLDSACTMPILLANPSTVCSSTVASLEYDGSVACAPKYRYWLYTVGAATSLPTDVYTRSQGTCVKSSIPGGVSAYQVSEIPSTSFVAAQEQVDP